MNYEAAVTTLDPLIALLESQAAKDPVAAGLLPTAYELRARSRFQLGNADGASADFRLLLKVAPGYSLTGQVSQRVSRLFEDLRKANVGKMILNLSPADADLQLDGVPFTPAAGEIPLAVGWHTLSGRRVGCRSAAQTFTVMPGATTEVVLTLERISASLALVTSPTGVEILVDGISRGRSEAGPLTPQWAEPVAKLGLAPEAVSRPFVIDDLGTGTHTVELLRDCHIKVEKRVDIDKPADFLLDPIKLEKAVGIISVDAQAPGAAVLLDGDSRGTVPLQLDDVCEGGHVVEVRSPWGRHVERITVKPGDKLNVRGTVRPAVALLSVTGLPEGYRGTDLRLALERGFGAATTMTLFAPSADKVQQALKSESLSPGWLAFDRWRRPVGAPASAITPAARLEIGSRLARFLDVQGVAELTARPGGERTRFLLSVLASESSQPDVLEIDLENPASINGVIARLDQIPPMHRPSVGLAVADVLDVAGAVITSVDPDSAAAKAGLTPGDAITKVDGQPVADGSSFGRLVAQGKAGDKLTDGGEGQGRRHHGRGVDRHAGPAPRGDERPVAPVQQPRAWPSSAARLGGRRRDRPRRATEPGGGADAAGQLGGGADRAREGPAAGRPRRVERDGAVPPRPVLRSARPGGGRREGLARGRDRRPEPAHRGRAGGEGAGGTETRRRAEIS